LNIYQSNNSRDNDNDHHHSHSRRRPLLEANAHERLGRAYKSFGDFVTARKHYEKCLSTRASILGEESLEVADVYHELGIVHYENGDYNKAEEVLRNSVEIKVKKLQGEDNLEVANTVFMLGKTCTKLNSPDEAMMYFEQARLSKQQRYLDNGNESPSQQQQQQYHLEIAEMDLEIGHAHFVKKEFQESLECFHTYLRARRVAVGDDEITGDVLHSIGMAEYELRQYDAALKSFASALALYRVLLGDDHLSVAKTLYSLGLVYDAKHEYKESMKYHKEAFRLRRRLLGEDDLNVAQSLDCISNLYTKQPNLEKALQSMKEALRIRTQKLGKKHMDVASSLFGMGVIYAECNELEKAMECYAVCLNIRQEQLGSCVEVAQTLHNMGTVYAKHEDYESALTHWRRALVSYREAGHSDEDHLVAVTIGNINMAESFLDEQGISEVNPCGLINRKSSQTKTNTTTS